MQPPPHMSNPAGLHTGEQVTVQLTHTSSSPYDCLATSAMVFSTEVKDTDFDGLLDVWETGDESANPPTHAPLLEPNGQPLPNLARDGCEPERAGHLRRGSRFMSYVNQLLEADDTFDDLPGYHTPLGHVTRAHPFAEPARSRRHQRPYSRVPPLGQNPNRDRSQIHFDIGNRYQDSYRTSSNFSARTVAPCTSGLGPELPCPRR